MTDDIPLVEPWERSDNQLLYDINCLNREVEVLTRNLENPALSPERRAELVEELNTTKGDLNAYLAEKAKRQG